MTNVSHFVAALLVTAFTFTSTFQIMVA